MLNFTVSSYNILFWIQKSHTAEVFPLKNSVIPVKYTK